MWVLKSLLPRRVGVCFDRAEPAFGMRRVACSVGAVRRSWLVGWSPKPFLLVGCFDCLAA